MPVEAARNLKQAVTELAMSTTPRLETIDIGTRCYTSGGDSTPTAPFEHTPSNAEFNRREMTTSPMCSRSDLRALSMPRSAFRKTSTQSVRSLDNR